MNEDTYKVLILWVWPQGKAGELSVPSDDNDGAGYPLFTFVDESIFKKETFLGKPTGRDMSMNIEGV